MGSLPYKSARSSALVSRLSPASSPLTCPAADEMFSQFGQGGDMAAQLAKMGGMEGLADAMGEEPPRGPPRPADPRAAASQKGGDDDDVPDLETFDVGGDKE